MTAPTARQRTKPLKRIRTDRPKQTRKITDPKGLRLTDPQAELYALLRVHGRVTSMALLVPSGTAAHKRSATILVELGLATWDRPAGNERWAIRFVSEMDRRVKGLPHVYISGSPKVTVIPRQSNPR